MTAGSTLSQLIEDSVDTFLAPIPNTVSLASTSWTAPVSRRSGSIVLFRRRLTCITADTRQLLCRHESLAASRFFPGRPLLPCHQRRCGLKESK